MLKRARRWLYLLHRWLGIALCLWFVLLFASGVIMMYVEYPELTEDERLRQLPALDAEALRLSPAQAALRAGATTYRSLTLTMVLGRPAYEFRTATGESTTVFADDGRVLGAISAEQALLAARVSGLAAGTATPRHTGVVAVDQWTVSAVLNPDRPLHRIALDDAAGTVLYVSGSRGRLVRDTNRRERFWNWLGSTVHWLYPWQFRQHVGLWTDVLTWLSLAGVVSVASGAVVGWWRLRLQRRYPGGRLTPFRGWQRWHHLLGLGCVVFVTTWSFSGLMSMLPWGLFDNATAAEEQILRYEGGLLEAWADFPEPVAALRAVGDGSRQVEWRRLGDLHYLVVSGASGERQVFVSGSGDAATALHAQIGQRLNTLQPTAALTSQRLLSAYDSWYYSHHNRLRPLPVLEVRFDDAERCWYYLDLGSGAVVQRLTATDRWARWLYNGLHSLDFALLFQRRPLWDVVLVLLLLLGAAFSLTAVVIGWRRLVS